MAAAEVAAVGLVPALLVRMAQADRAASAEIQQPVMVEQGHLQIYSQGHWALPAANAVVAAVLDQVLQAEDSQAVRWGRVLSWAQQLLADGDALADLAGLDAAVLVRGAVSPARDACDPPLP